METKMANLETLSVKELEEHIVEAQRILAKKKVEQVQKNREEVEKLARSLGTSINELFGITTPKQKAEPKKRDVRYTDDTGKEYYRALQGWDDDTRKKYKDNVKNR